ncbi:hypothetical protein BVRB_5g109560 [Beta vulgaris subsp. vulgaris]|nr:hypothetical protein BVRB_5g109560 [Beta vulgaris subsp. vulgaris]
MLSTSCGQHESVCSNAKSSIQKKKGGKEIAIKAV